MDTLRRQVLRARRRLVLQKLLRYFAWSLLAALVVAAAAVAAPKLWPLPLADSARLVWDVAWLGGAAAAALLAAGVLTWITRDRPLDAAIEIDRRFELRERISSALALSAGELDTEAGQALLGDALRRVERIDVDSRFPVRVGWPALAALAPATVAAVLIFLIPDAAARQAPPPEPEALAVRQQIRAATEDLKKKLAERRRQAEEDDLKEAADLIRRLEEGLDQMAGRSPDERREALVELNNLAKELEERRQQLGDGEEIRRQLAQLKDVRQGPAERLAKAMQQGDFQQAMNELDKLREQLRDGELTDEQKKQLAEQLQRIEERLAELAQAHEQARQQLEEQIRRAEQQGDRAQAGALQQQLDRLNRQNERMDRMRNLADKLGQCAECMQEGDPAAAAERLAEMAGDLDELKRQLDEMEMLDDALDQIARAKDAMNCKQCAGEGCAACQGKGDLLAQGMGDGQGEGPPDIGLGEGQGVGARPEEESDTGLFDSRVRAEPQQGEAVTVDQVPGPNVAGNVREEIKSALEASRRESARPLTEQRLPRAQREHAQEYFDRFREGDR